MYIPFLPNTPLCTHNKWKGNPHLYFSAPKTTSPKYLPSRMGNNTIQWSADKETSSQEAKEGNTEEKDEASPED